MGLNENSETSWVSEETGLFLSILNQATILDLRSPDSLLQSWGTIKAAQLQNWSQRTVRIILDLGVVLASVH